MIHLKCDNCLREMREGQSLRKGPKGSTFRRGLVCYPCFWALAREVKEARKAEARSVPDVKSGPVRWFRMSD